MSIRRTDAKGVNILTAAVVTLVQVATLLIGGVKALVRVANGKAEPDQAWSSSRGPSTAR